jgi:cold-inducible RNA-binding protein
MAQTKVYVGNLPWSYDSETLEELFAKHGVVVSASVVTDRSTGRSRGFGFVEMEAQQAAEAAIKEYNDLEIDGRRMKVNFSQDRPTKGRGGRRR